MDSWRNLLFNEKFHYFWEIIIKLKVLDTKNQEFPATFIWIWSLGGSIFSGSETATRIHLSSSMDQVLIWCLSQRIGWKFYHPVTKRTTFSMFWKSSTFILTQKYHFTQNLSFCISQMSFLPPPAPVVKITLLQGEDKELSTSEIQIKQQLWPKINHLTKRHSWNDQLSTYL